MLGGVWRRMNRPKSMSDNTEKPPLPPYDEWRKLPADEAARIWARHYGKDAEEEGCMAAIFEYFGEDEGGSE